MTLEITVPGSKSMTQRALVIAALADQPSQVVGALSCEDSHYLVDILRALGAKVVPNWDACTIAVEPPAALNEHVLFEPPKDRLYCGNAGTAMRFSSALALVTNGSVILDGDQRMRERPIGALGDALAKLGLSVSYLDQHGYPPLKLERTTDPAAETSVNTSMSSQYASGLLLVGPRLQRGIVIRLEGEAVSRPYLEMTTTMMQRAGAQVTWTSEQRVVVGTGSVQLAGLVDATG